MRFLALGLFAAAAFATAAQADPVRYDFNGVLTTADVASGFASDAGLATGSGAFSGHVTFSSLAPDLDPSPAELYEAVEFELILGSFTFSSANIGFDTAFARVDTSLPAFVLDFYSGSDFSSLFGESMALTLSFGDAVPGVVQNPSLAGATANLFLTSGDGDFLFADGTVDALAMTNSSAVPEPATWATLIAGFALVGAMMRSRRRDRLENALT